MSIVRSGNGDFFSRIRFSKHQWDSVSHQRVGSIPKVDGWLGSCMCAFQVLIMENDDPTWLSYVGGLNHQVDRIRFHSRVGTDGIFEKLRCTGSPCVVPIGKATPNRERPGWKMVEITHSGIGSRKNIQGDRILGMFPTFRMDRLIQSSAFSDSVRCSCWANTQQLKCSVSELATRVATRSSA